MHKVFIQFLLIISILFFIGGCNIGKPSSPSVSDQEEIPDDEEDNEDEEDNTVKDIDKSFWGPWLGVGTDNTWYISGSQILVNGSSRNYLTADSNSIILDDGALTFDSSDILRYSFNQSTVPVYLFRASGATNRFTAKVEGEVTNVAGARSLSSLGGIDVIIQNLNNPEDSQQVITDEDGNLEAVDTIIGDDYRISIPEQDGISEVIDADVTPLFNGQDLGIINLINDGANFKMNLTTDERLDLLRADGSTEYTVTLQISNIGTRDMDEAQYTITPTNGLTISSGQISDILGTVFAGETKTIDLGVMCPLISEDYKDMELEISVNDIYKTQTWTETLTLRFLKITNQFSLCVKSEEIHSIDGLVLDPEGIATPFHVDSFDILINFIRKTGEWTVIFGGGGTGSETKYALGIDPEIDTVHNYMYPFDDYLRNNLFGEDYFSILTDASTGEPNNSFDSSTEMVVGQTLMQYLGAKDVDIYSFNFADTSRINFVSEDSDSGTTPSDILFSGSYGDEEILPGNTGSLQKSGHKFGGWGYFPIILEDTWNTFPIDAINPKSSLYTLYSTWIPENKMIKSISCGWYHALYLKNDGTLWGAGYFNGYIRHIPTHLMNDVEYALCGSSHNFIIKTDGSLWARGSNDYGELGTGNTTIHQSAFTQITSDVMKVAHGPNGGWHTLILKNDGTLYSTGNNDYGQLGLGDDTQRTSPTFVMSDVADIGAGKSHSLILKKDNTLWSVGSNFSGQLGVGDTVNRLIPEQILTDVQKVSAGGDFSMILKTDGTLWMCGENYYGQLGFGDKIDRPTPTQLMSDVSDISAGNYSALILKTDGTLWGTGSNYDNQLGLENIDIVLSPTQILSNVAVIDISDNASMVIKTDGTLWATGINGNGMFGDGTTIDKSIFEQIYP